MAKSKESFGKKEKEKKKKKKKQEKLQKREERKSNPKSGSLDDMIAYVDEEGNFTDTPPEPGKKKKIDADSIEVSVPKKAESANPTVRTGRIEFFNDAKGYGFIKELDTQEKYFVHINGLLEEVKERDKVSFELERGMKGMNAVRVKKI